MPVFSVIIEYCMDGRNSYDRPMVRPQSFVLHVYSALPPPPPLVKGVGTKNAWKERIKVTLNFSFRYKLFSIGTKGSICKTLACLTLFDTEEL